MNYRPDRVVRIFRWGFAVSFFVLLATLPQLASSQDDARLETFAVNPLDGMQFVAGIVGDGDEQAQKRPLEDKLLFEDGNFTSLVCKRYNFKSAPYWIRREGDRIHFLAELSSPTDGKMVWKGTIHDGKLSGTMRWTRERWYWTIDAKHTIRGELSNSIAPISLPAN